VVDWNNTAGFQKGNEKTLVAIYTAAGGTSEESKGQPFTQCIAYSNDRGRTWTKYEKNPVLKHIIGGNRDPKVVWHGPSKKWIMALYLDGNDYAFFSSPDLKEWTLLHRINVPGGSECPDFFPMALDGKADNIRWVWTAANGRYLVGSFDGGKFTPDGGVQQVDFGRNFYAVQTYSDIPETDGRRIQVSWMNGGKYPGMPFNQQMGFPCELKLRTFPEGIRMTRQPVKEIETLYGQEHGWSQETLRPGENLLKGLGGELWDIRAEVELGEATEFGFKIRGEKVAYRVKEKKLEALGASGPLEVKDGRLQVRVLVDRASLEVFGNEGKVSLTSCFVPKAEEKGLEVYCNGGNVRVVSLKVHELKSAWK
jgi:sucrose-6-phosphate hydrolase SacC (GH32 family)